MKRFKIVLLVLWFPLSLTYAQNYQFQAFWETKKGNTHEIGVLGVKESEFQKVFDMHNVEGLELTLIDGYDLEGELYINSIFKTPSGKAWMAGFGETGASYQNNYNKYVKNGDYRLAWVDSNLSGHKIRYAFIFTKEGRGGQKAYHGITKNKHQQYFEEWSTNGWSPINVSVVSVEGKRYYTAFYEKRKGSFALKSFMTRTDFETANAAYEKQGKALTI